MIRRHLYYSGSVQGVGFRFTAARAAANYTVVGYVKNLPDGRVEMVVEGDPEEVAAFLDDLADRMSGYIKDTKATIEPYIGEFSRFDIRF